MGKEETRTWTIKLDGDDIVVEVIEDLDFPELCEEIASEISSRIKMEHSCDIFGAVIKFTSDVGNSVSSGVGVHLRDGFASIFHFDRSHKVEYTNPNAFDEMAMIVQNELELHIGGPFSNLILSRASVMSESANRPVNKILFIKSAKELDEFVKGE